MFVPFLVHGVFPFFGLIRSSIEVQNVQTSSDFRSAPEGAIAPAT
jgi:hypothetical protein